MPNGVAHEHGDDVAPTPCGEADDLLYTAWTIIANAGGGDWSNEHSDWVVAAVRWRDQFHVHLEQHARQDR